ncbi:hypothetical protein KJ781_03865 [Patescibacteria group bacterium]|nr:hypothetical protein [Patescibacteria group bacterium]MBU1448652.1 hypothetical protein [Patescibacteria group bacterium]MBU2612951.1 hypothetical protein [Patescibacteria group bacterium]
MIIKRSIVARMLLVFLVFATAGGALYVGSMLLEPVTVAPMLFGKAKVAFDASADVSNNPIFQSLRPLGPGTVTVGQLGRINPFAPIPIASTSTAAQAITTEPVPEPTEEPLPIDVDVPPIETPPMTEETAVVPMEETVEETPTSLPSPLPTP